MKNCKQCQSPFEVTRGDLSFYEKVSPVYEGRKFLIPEPTFCPECRRQRRMAIRNERRLYRRKCDLCQQEKISSFAPESPYTVYCHECWWSDKWDPLKYGRDFDFSRPFFEQFNDLMHVMPKMALAQVGNENSDFTNWLAYSKNTFMSPGCYYVDTCLYGKKNQFSRDLIDCIFVDHSELLYASISCNQCYGSRYLFNARNCSDSAYLMNATGCKNCFMCSDVVGKEYHFKNQPYSEADYKKIVEEKSKLSPETLLREFLEFAESVPKRYQNQINCHDSFGDYLQNCKNAAFAFDSFDLEDVKYVTNCVKVKDSMDIINFDEKNELCYEICGGGDQVSRVLFSACPVLCSDSSYLYMCFNLQNSFGCDSMHQKKSYCILNKQYSREDYEKLVPKIIEHMQKTGEWGEFFPLSISPFAYNESMANEYFPLEESQISKQGWRYKELKDSVSDVTKTIPASRLPASITEIPDDVLNWAIVCEKSGRPFKIQRAELQFYRKMNIPLPRRHPDVRYLELMALKNPCHLYERHCAKCQAPIQTTYSPDRPEKVYCEACYLKEVY